MPSRYLIGIDLGTTNSVVAYIDTRECRRCGRPLFMCSPCRSWWHTGKSARFPHFLLFFISPPKMSCLRGP